MIWSCGGQTGTAGRSRGFASPSRGSVAAPSGTGSGSVVENRSDQTLGSVSRILQTLWSPLGCCRPLGRPACFFACLRRSAPRVFGQFLHLDVSCRLHRPCLLLKGPRHQADSNGSAPSSTSPPAISMLDMPTASAHPTANSPAPAHRSGTSDSHRLMILDIGHYGHDVPASQPRCLSSTR